MYPCLFDFSHRHLLRLVCGHSFCGECIRGRFISQFNDWVTVRPRAGVGSDTFPRIPVASVGLKMRMDILSRWYNKRFHWRHLPVDHDPTEIDINEAFMDEYGLFVENVNRWQRVVTTQTNPHYACPCGEPVLELIMF